MVARLESITGIKVSKPRFAGALASLLEQLESLRTMGGKDRPLGWPLHLACTALTSS